MTSQPRERAYLLTVGTGDMKRLEESLFLPLRKSIASGSWARIILLPSKITEGFARTVREGIAEIPVDIEPLPSDGLENDVDACFAHYDRVISALRIRGFREVDIIVDFTRGTKAMSAALVLAALRHDVAEMRYIVGERDSRGMVVAGTERVNSVSPTVATARKRLDRARGFFVGGNFAAALELLPDPAGAFSDPWPSDLVPTAAAIRPLAQFYAAWDRLDYRTANHVKLPDPADLPLDWLALAPRPDIREWVKSLAQPLPESGRHQAMATRLRMLAADIFANGERRIRQYHFEDAVLRAYRVLELIGQARLFEKGLDSARIDPSHPVVEKLAKDLERKRSQRFGHNDDGTLTAGRELVARLLKRLGDPMAGRLLNFDKQAGIPRVTSRNFSVLVHGFESVGPEEAAPLQSLYAALEKLLEEDDGGRASERLTIARSLALAPD